MIDAAEILDQIWEESRAAAEAMREAHTIAISPAEVAAIGELLGMKPDDVPGRPVQIAGVPVQVVDKLEAGIILPAPGRPLWMGPELGRPDIRLD